MGAYQAFVDLSFQGRLRKSAELYQAEIYYFLQLLEQYGMEALIVPGYSTIVLDANNSLDRTEFVLKLRGVWTRLWLEERTSGVFVLYDRSG